MAIIRPYLQTKPVIAEGAFIAENATLIGDVTIAETANVWYGAVLRGDVGWIKIGKGTNIQDLACLHTTGGVSNTDVGEYVTIGHGAILHGSVIGDGCLIGMGSIVLDNANVGAESLVAAGTVMTPRTVIPPRSLVRGQPGKVVRPLEEHEWQQGRASALYYIELAKAYG
jgi:carbonic anhydrase/acetyltransferase-like protein (isoleucine patch superfamily)